MSAITSDWAPIETEKPVTPPVESGKAFRREEEFRSALDRYIAGYVAEQQKRRIASRRPRPATAISPSSGGSPAGCGVGTGSRGPTPAAPWNLGRC
jgi:hypothetical protein